MQDMSTEPLLPLGQHRNSVGGPGSAIDNTARYIRTLIFSGELGAGERLPPERELCEQLGVSRVTLRAALTVLQTLGFVVAKRGKNGGSWIVDSVTLSVRWNEWLAANEDRFGQMLVFHRMIEKEIAASAAANRTEEDLELLEATCVPPAEGDSPEANNAAIAKWHLGFHKALARAAHNEYLERAMVTIRGDMFVGVPPAGRSPAMSELLKVHRAILEAVRAQDPKSATEAMTAHDDFLDDFFGDPRGTANS